MPFFAQSDLECGPAALAMVLAYGGEAITPDALVAQVYTPGRRGSLQSALVAAARRHGRETREIRGLPALLDTLESGRPVIVLQNLGLSWWQVWHYSVVLGIDFAAREVWLHSGKLERRAVPLRVFERTWRRADFWGLVLE